MRYSIEPGDRVYVKGYGFLSFAKNTCTPLSNKYSQKLLDSAEKSMKLTKEAQKQFWIEQIIIIKITEKLREKARN